MPLVEYLNQTDTKLYSLKEFKVTLPEPYFIVDYFSET